MLGVVLGRFVVLGFELCGLLFGLDAGSLLADALLLGELLRHEERFHEADHDDYFRDEEGDEAGAAQLQFEGGVAESVGGHEGLAYGRVVRYLRVAAEDQEEAVQQDQPRDDEVSAAYVRLDLEHDEFEQLGNGLEHEQTAQQLWNIVDDVRCMEQQYETETEGVCSAEQGTDEMMHNWVYF